MEPESVISLLDSSWYNHEIFNKLQNPSSPSHSDANPHHKTQENSQETITTMPTCWSSKMDLSSPDSVSGYNSDPFSPVSVLPNALLRSEKEMSKKQSKLGRRSRTEAEETEGCIRKSLSELESEEVKGFMDLGFDLSGEDANSRLVEVIPGLQKLVKQSCEETEDCSRVECCKFRPRPYLSEAWVAMERKKKKTGMVEWRIPAMSNEVDMKQSLRLWAHTVASNFR